MTGNTNTNNNNNNNTKPTVRRAKSIYIYKERKGEIVKSQKIINYIEKRNNNSKYKHKYGCSTIKNQAFTIIERESCINTLIC